MKHAFMVQTLGYWGRGQALPEAAQNCFRAGAPRTARAVVDLILGDDAPEITHDGMNMTIEEGAQILRIGKWFKLDTLLKLDVD